MSLAHTKQESMAACLLAECASVTWSNALGLIKEGGPTADRYLKMGQAALDHVPYLDREDLIAMLEAEIGVCPR